MHELLKSFNPYAEADAKKHFSASEIFLKQGTQKGSGAEWSLIIPLKKKKKKEREREREGVRSGGESGKERRKEGMVGGREKRGKEGRKRKKEKERKRPNYQHFLNFGNNCKSNIF